MNNQFDIEKIPAEKFEFAQTGNDIHDEKFKTKPIGYLEDAWIRFRKNKASIVAAIIIIIIALYAIIVPFISNYKLGDKDGTYVKSRPYIPALSFLKAFDGGIDMLYNERYLMYVAGIGMGAEDGEGTGDVTWEVGMASDYSPIVELGEEKMLQGSAKREVRVNSYYMDGFQYEQLTVEQYEAILAWEKETGLQVIYPMIDIFNAEYCDVNNQADANYWYRHDAKNNPIGENGKPLTLEQVMENGFVDNYLRDEDGNVQYYIKKDTTMVQARVLYYNYYLYKNGSAPIHYLGTDGQGFDIFVRLAYGLRTSLALAVFVSIINLVVGAIYGAIEGYYGGWVDLIGERISDILNGIPFLVVATLVQLHLVQTNKIGPFAGIMLAFCMTGWIGPAYRVRAQFYRFKNQEYILAARTLGARDRRLMFKHIFPNAIGTIITSVVLVIPSNIFTESMLSYIGIVSFEGRNSTSLGTLLSAGQKYMVSDPHILLVPAVAISLLMISFNLFGNGLRDAFNPSLRGAEE